MTLTNASAKSTLGKLTVGRLIRNAKIRSAGNIAGVTAGGMVGSTLFAGIDAAVTGLPSSIDDFSNQTVSIKKIQLRGGEGIADAFVDSVIGGFNLGKVALGRVAQDNAGVALGLAAHTAKSVTFQVGDRP